jgi:hypothetical protein
MRVGYRWLAFVAFAAFVAAGSASAQTDSDGEALDAFLTVPYQERLASALTQEDHRYLAVAGSALEAPGAPPYWIERGRHQIIPGSIGAFGSGANGALAERALAYARAYNESLERELKNAAP